MHLIESLQDFHPSTKPLVLALGNFDGLHLGHQKLLQKVKESAQNFQGTSAVLTFRQHPQTVLHPLDKPLLLNSAAHKLWMLEELGLDLCFMIPFTEIFSRMSAENFVEEVLVNRLKVRKIFLGANARFGHGRKGDGSVMHQLSDHFGFEFEEVTGVQAGGELVSSSRIRKLIQQGNLKETCECLGRPYRILSEVIHGDGRGAELGFPTANLKIDQEVMPPEGVYAVKVRKMSPSPNPLLVRQKTDPPIFERDGEMARVRGGGFSPDPWLSGVLNFGSRPTFYPGEKVSVVAEVFILDLKDKNLSLYGCCLEVAFYEKLREEQAFSSAEALKAQIGQDIESARAVLTDGRML
ncbi:MAG: bifunctional riboflavin kinase/FMN adenylyltransferase [Candidatus Omnitrophica bacterium]|nr:bifunctional riboflavin kinase/FMN adenylyltransferase [Candidatus Omnitrophota bacterium]